MKTLKAKKKKINTFVAFLLIGIFLLVTLFPFFWMISTSFKIKGEFFTRPPIFIPDRFNFDAILMLIELHSDQEVRRP